ncbi:hypothetical protein [Ferdinandcohnia sp. Marseille-Q9671]
MLKFSKSAAISLIERRKTQATVSLLSGNPYNDFYYLIKVVQYACEVG